MSTFSSPASATSGLQGYDLDSKKSSKKKAEYTAGPVEEQPCRDCTMFQQPNACSAVRGLISPQGHCKYFKASTTAKARESEMDDLKIFIPLTKVDVAQRLVYGVATAELPDVSGEVCDYASTKPHYQKWSEQFSKATDGKSLGNLRSMHGNNAAGKLTEIAFNDEARRIEICGKVVDDAEWKKVEEGVYTGFSQGGRYLKRWQDPVDAKLTRYTAEPIEISLVDNPCLPEATFSVVKADGTTEMRKFKAPIAPLFSEVQKRATELAKAVGDETKWAEHLAAANDELTKVAPPVATTTETTPAPTGEDGEWEQVWVSKRLPGKEFKTKGELRKALVDLDAQEAAAKIAAPVLDALNTMKDALAKNNGGDAGDKAGKTVATAAGDGTAVAKKDFTDDERKKLASEGKAMKDGSYPTPTKASFEDAVQAFGRAKNKASTKRYLMRRAKEEGWTDLLPDDWKGKSSDDTKKIAGDGALLKTASLYSLANLIQLLASIEAAEEDFEFPGYGLGMYGGAQLPKELCDRFGALVVELGDIVAEALDVILAAMKEEEASEAMAHAAAITTLRKLAGDRVLAKVGAKHSKADKEKIKQAHDLLVGLDPDCCDAEDDDGGDAEKVVQRLQGQLEANNAAFAKQLDGILVLVKQMADTPLPMGTSSVTVVDKTNDGVQRRQTAGDGDALAQLADVALARARAMTTR